MFFWSCVVYGSPDSGLLRTSNACLFCNKTFKNLFPCNLRPFAIEITLAIFRHSPSCSHNNWIVTVDEMGCEVTSCKLNSPTPPHRPCGPPEQSKCHFAASRVPRRLQAISWGNVLLHLWSFFLLSDAHPISFKAQCLPVFTYEFVVYRTSFNQLYVIHTGNS